MKILRHHSLQFRFVILFPAFVFLSSFTGNKSFREEQCQSKRVQNAFREKEKNLQTEFSSKGISFEKCQLLLCAFKEEKKLQVWAKNQNETKYKLVKEYPFCTLSGTTGPKRKAGDGQVPEGFYYINRFNPYSNFYLSLGINYPNKSDQYYCKGNPGGDIFIHGNCVSIGCIPITDDKIKELYVCAVQSKSNGQSRIPVYIFPGKMDGNKFTANEKDSKYPVSLIEFWKNIKSGYDLFQKNHEELNYKIDSSGKYSF